MKIKCPLCGYENEEGSKFCKNCYIPLTKPSFSNDNPHIKKVEKKDKNLKEEWIPDIGKKGTKSDKMNESCIEGLTEEQKEGIDFILENQLSDLRSLEKEFIALLLGGKWEWPEFEKWHKIFTELNYFPYMWASVESRPLEEIPEAIRTLEIFSHLSLNARRLLIGNNAVNKANQITMAVEDMGRKVGMMRNKTLKVIEELKELNLAKYPLEIIEKLPILKVNDLKEICEEYNLQKTGKKMEIIERLSQNIAEKELRSLLPSEAQRDAARIGFSLSLRAKNYVNWNIAKIKLLTHTLSFLSYKLENVKRYKQEGIQKVKILGLDNDPCPICAPKHKKIVSIDDLDRLPPFHPGCRCITIAYFDQRNYF